MIHFQFEGMKMSCDTPQEVFDFLKYARNEKIKTIKPIYGGFSFFNDLGSEFILMFDTVKRAINAAYRINRITGKKFCKNISNGHVSIIRLT